MTDTKQQFIQLPSRVVMKKNRKKIVATSIKNNVFREINKTDNLVELSLYEISKITNKLFLDNEMKRAIKIYIVNYYPFDTTLNKKKQSPIILKYNSADEALESKIMIKSLDENSEVVIEEKTIYGQNHIKDVMKDIMNFTKID